MIAIKGMEMPSACVTTIKFKGKVVSNMKCPLYHSCTHKDVYNKDVKPKDCPVIEIEERKVGKWLSAEEYALKIGVEVTEDIKKSLYKVCPFCEQTVFIERNYCSNCGAIMKESEVKK